jgi:hypothetical protein
VQEALSQLRVVRIVVESSTAPDVICQEALDLAESDLQDAIAGYESACRAAFESAHKAKRWHGIDWRDC